MSEWSLRGYAAAAGRPRGHEVPPPSAALELVQGHRELDLRSEPAFTSGFGLESWIPALLAVSRKNGFIKFDPWDARIRIKRFRGSLVCYQYNPFRDPGNRHAEGQKPAPARIKTDFLDWETFPDNEHYLVWTSDAGRRYAILVQPVPIVPDHLIIASLDCDPKTQKHYPQRMRDIFLADMHELEILLGQLGYALAYNDFGAGASVDHFHTQAVPAAYLPLLPLWLSGRLRPQWTVYKGRDTVISLLGGEASQPASRQPSWKRWFGLPAYPATAVVLEATGPDELLALKRSLWEMLARHGHAFNSVGWKKPDGVFAEVVYPRGHESIWSNSLKAGYVEMSGMIVIPDHKLYQSIRVSTRGEQGLAEAGLPCEAQGKLFQEIIHSL